MPIAGPSAADYYDGTRPVPPTSSDKWWNWFWWRPVGEAGGLNVAWAGSAFGSTGPASNPSEPTSRSHAPEARREGRAGARLQSCRGPQPSQLMSRVNSTAALHQLGVIPLASVLGGVLVQTIGIHWLIAISTAGPFEMFVAMARLSEIRKV